jgi:tRNA uridine 5-carboxymethylaminomethyl modification enzyme
LIDDLITKGTEEPYRMFTSRAEYRILLRQDNADERLTPKSHALGLASDGRMRLLDQKQTNKTAIKKIFNNTSVRPEEMNILLDQKKSAPINQKVKAISILSRPNISINDMILADKKLQKELAAFDETSIICAEIEMKYDGYIKRERDMADKLTRLEEIKIPPTIDYASFSSLSAEAVEKLTKLQPETIGQASRISGVSPADVSVLMVFLGR